MHTILSDIATSDHRYWKLPQLSEYFVGLWNRVHCHSLPSKCAHRQHWCSKSGAESDELTAEPEPPPDEDDDLAVVSRAQKTRNVRDGQSSTTDTKQRQQHIPMPLKMYPFQGLRTHRE